ncbi:unnamed protein product [Pipistrellus nathusii]|uniref:Uncharacterized protein n=1 Tax=Pipistrellus nathusii TaxID=59473 RepID=A0ABP0ACZ7_PIPNA
MRHLCLLICPGFTKQFLGALKDLSSQETFGLLTWPSSKSMSVPESLCLEEAGKGRVAETNRAAFTQQRLTSVVVKARTRLARAFRRVPPPAAPPKWVKSPQATVKALLSGEQGRAREKGGSAVSTKDKGLRVAERTQGHCRESPVEELKSAWRGSGVWQCGGVCEGVSAGENCVCVGGGMRGGWSLPRSPRFCAKRQRVAVAEPGTPFPSLRDIPAPARPIGGAQQLEASKVLPSAGIVTPSALSFCLGQASATTVAGSGFFWTPSPSPPPHHPRTLTAPSRLGALGGLKLHRPNS